MLPLPPDVMSPTGPSSVLCAVAAVHEVERHRDDLALEPRGARAHVALEHVHVAVHPEHFVHEVVVVVVAAVHGPRALAGLPRLVLVGRDVAELGDDRVAVAALRRHAAEDGEAVGVRVCAHDMPFGGVAIRR